MTARRSEIARRNAVLRALQAKSCDTVSGLATRLDMPQRDVLSALRLLHARGLVRKDITRSTTIWEATDA